MGDREYVIEGGVAIADLLFDKLDGLIPVVAQEHRSGLVLMVAFADRAAVDQTARSGYAHYYSRTRQQMWRKGATSGNYQRVRQILVDCDSDTLLYIVDQQGGGACHTGAYSCFYRRLIT